MGLITSVFRDFTMRFRPVMLGHDTCSTRVGSMRFVALLFVLTGCVFSSSGELQTVGDPDEPPPPFGSQPGACASDDQCVLTSATCCECPSFATSIDDPKLEACGQVDCDNDSLVCPTN